MGVLYGSIISSGSLGSCGVSFGDVLIFIKNILPINIGGASCNVVPMYLSDYIFDCDDKKGREGGCLHIRPMQCLATHRKY